MALAWQMLGQGKAKEAETLCANLVKLVPEHGHAWFLRGVAAGALGKHKLALKHFEQVKNAPDLLPSLAQARGRIYLSTGEYEIALDRFQEALSYSPEDHQCYYYLGLIKLRQQAVDEARRFLRQAVLLEPSFAPAHFELGVLALNAGEATKAVNSFQAAAKQMADVPEVMNNLGLSQQAAADLKGAEASYRRAIELRPTYAEAWFNLGMVLKSLAPAQADAALNKAISLNPALKEALPDGA